LYVPAGISGALSKRRPVHTTGPTSLVDWPFFVMIWQRHRRLEFGGKSTLTAGVALRWGDPAAKLSRSASAQRSVGVLSFSP
jgi:hypothetical protein